MGSEPRRGEKIAVQTPTHLTAVLDFTSGPMATLVTSFEAVPGATPNLEVYGSEAALMLPDPNTFGGPVRLKKAGSSDWEEIPITRPYAQNSRGMGLVDLANAIRNQRPHRASGVLGYHTLEVMHAVLESSERGTHISTSSRVARPDALLQGIGEYILE